MHVIVISELIALTLNTVIILQFIIINSKTSVIFITKGLLGKVLNRVCYKIPLIKVKSRVSLGRGFKTIVRACVKFMSIYQDNNEYDSGC